MSGTLNNGLNNFDEHLKNVFDNYQHCPNTKVWGKLRSKLLKKDAVDFVSLKKLKQSFKPQTKVAAMHAKIWATYAAAACLTVGVVFGAAYYVKNNILNTDTKTTLPVPSNNNTKSLTIPAATLNDSQTVVSSPNSVENNTATVIQQKSTVVPDKQYNETVNTTTAVVNNNSTNTTKTQSANVNTTTGSSTSANKVLNLLNYIKKLNPQNTNISQETGTQNSTSDIQPEINPNIQENAVNPNIDNQVYNLEIPNVFTPNGDGYNDFFVIKNLDKYSENSLLVADRNGKIVYDKNNYQNDWGGQNLPDGTYYYIVSYKDKNSNKGLIKGQITILRK